MAVTLQDTHDAGARRAVAVGPDGGWACSLLAANPEWVRLTTGVKMFKLARDCPEQAAAELERLDASLLAAQKDDHQYAWAQTDELRERGAPESEVDAVWEEEQAAVPALAAAHDRAWWGYKLGIRGLDHRGRQRANRALAFPTWGVTTTFASLQDEARCASHAPVPSLLRPARPRRRAPRRPRTVRRSSSRSGDSGSDDDGGEEPDGQPLAARRHGGVAAGVAR